MHSRLDRLHAMIQEQNLAGIFITKPENRRYFSGFTGSSGMLVITDSSNRLLTDFRYVEQAEAQAHEFEIIRHGSSLYETLSHLVQTLGSARIGFEADFVTYDTMKALQKALTVELVPVHLDSLRMVKDPSELKIIQKAVEIADEAFNHILQYIRPGVSESDISLELEYTMRKLGAEKNAFDIIVASGVRSSLPHGVASDKKIQPGDFITMDFGAVYQGYHSDITRTVVAGKASPKQREVYDIVMAAQHAGIKAVRKGLTGVQVDAIARKIIADAGYAEYFGHGLGHGVGLVIHEEPRLSPSANIILANNMVVTVEPGIYLPDWGGVRIEDMVVVDDAGCKILTGSSKQFIELDW